MASITVRNLNEETKKRLRRLAAEHGRSLEAEVREVLDREARLPSPPEIGRGEAIRRRFAPLGGIELEPFPDEPMPEPRTRRPDRSRRRK
jgi:plasmid stability protein